MEVDFIFVLDSHALSGHLVRRCGLNIEIKKDLFSIFQTDNIPYFSHFLFENTCIAFSCGAWNLRT